MDRPYPGDLAIGETGDGWRRRPVVWRAALGGLGGWKGRGTAVLFGAMAAAAMPPVHLIFLLVPSFVGWLWMTEGRSGWRGAFAVGWWYGVGFFAAGLYWVSAAFLVEPEKHAWMIPFAVFLMAGGFALFPAIVAVAVRFVPGTALTRALALAIVWTAAEWVRSWFLTGFPWNLMGTVWAFSDAMMQPAALFGTYGLGMLSVAIAAAPAGLGDASLGRRRGLAGVVAAAVLLGGLWLGGEIRLAAAAYDEVPGVRLRLVQPNIEQKTKWKLEFRDRHLAMQVAMSRADDGGPAPTHVIWPETAATFFIGRDASRRAFFAQAAPPGGLVISGAPRATPAGEKPYRVWNSLQAVDRAGRVVGTYDKSHLIPFGEYVPLRPWLTIPKVTEGRQDFTAGGGPVSMSLEGLPPFSPLICYEVIFPGHVVRRDDRPAWMINLTNDAWYGRSAGPYQHLAAARMRAVEEGLPLVRVATTGISGVFDSQGRTRARIELGRAGTVDSALPVAASPTPYARFGNLTIVVLVVLLAGGLPVSREWRQTGK